MFSHILSYSATNDRPAFVSLTLAVVQAQLLAVKALIKARA